MLRVPSRLVSLHVPGLARLFFFFLILRPHPPAGCFFSGGARSNAMTRLGRLWQFYDLARGGAFPARVTAGRRLGGAALVVWSTMCSLISATDMDFMRRLCYGYASRKGAAAWRHGSPPSSLQWCTPDPSGPVVPWVWDSRRCLHNVLLDDFLHTAGVLLPYCFGFSLWLSLRLLGC